MTDSYICDAIRTPIGRYGGALSSVRPDDLAAFVIQALMQRNPDIRWNEVDDVILGCANQAGEDNRNIARMAALLAGLPENVPGATINRLCGSGLDAVMIAARAIRSGGADLIVAGGVESMSRAPFVLGKAGSAFDRAPRLEDSTMGWRFINPALKERCGVDTMPQTAETVAAEYGISREDQDMFALESQRRAALAQASGRFDSEITPISIQKKGGPVVVSRDEHPRETTMEMLARLAPVVVAGGTVTAGNSSGINDGAAALIIASADAVRRYGLKPRARILGGAVAGVTPRIMGMGPVPAIRKLLGRLNIGLSDFDVIELNEAFAAQAVAVLRELGFAADAAHVNRNGGAIALGHPLGMSGARLALTATEELARTGGTRALCAMCIGVGQGIALAIERC